MNSFSEPNWVAGYHSFIAETTRYIVGRMHRALQYICLNAATPQRPATTSGGE